MACQLGVVEAHDGGWWWWWWWLYVECDHGEARHQGQLLGHSVETIVFQAQLLYNDHSGWMGEGRVCGQ